MKTKNIILLSIAALLIAAAPVFLAYTNYTEASYQASKGNSVTRFGYAGAEQLKGAKLADMLAALKQASF